jgi:hypothetical protein
VTSGRRYRWLPVVALLLTACAGPRAHVDIIGKQEPLDVAFGKPEASIVKGNPPLAPVPSGLGVLPVTNPGVTYVDVPGELPPPPPPPACPSANPLSAPAEVAGDSVTSQVPAGTFPYRYSGVTADGKAGQRFSGISKHVVTGSAVGNGVYRFSIDITMLGATTTWSYLAAPGVGTAANVQGAIELTSVSGNGGFGYNASFTPDKPLRVFAQPAYPGATWQDAESDAQSGTVATVSGTIDSKDRVDACGTKLDAWKSTMTLTITSPNESIKTTVSTWWATQFGGLPIQEVQSYSGTAGGQQVKGDVSAFIAVDPMKKAKK